jgi:hypothetical protein
MLRRYYGTSSPTKKELDFKDFDFKEFDFKDFKKNTGLSNLNGPLI